MEWLMNMTPTNKIACLQFCWIKCSMFLCCQDCFGTVNFWSSLLGTVCILSKWCLDAMLVQFNFPSCVKLYKQKKELKQISKFCTLFRHMFLKSEFVCWCAITETLAKCNNVHYIVKIMSIYIFNQNICFISK